MGVIRSLYALSDGEIDNGEIDIAGYLSLGLGVKPDENTVMKLGRSGASVHMANGSLGKVPVDYFRTVGVLPPTPEVSLHCHHIIGAQSAFNKRLHQGRCDPIEEIPHLIRTAKSAG